MDIGYNYTLWKEYHAKQILNVDLRSHPSLLLTGASGSGKSYALKYLLGKLSDKPVNSSFCNFKRSNDFQFLDKYRNYFSYMECSDGLCNFYETFKNFQNTYGGFNGKYHILIFDEFPAFILSTVLKDKKTADAYKMMVSEILMLGRSYGFGIWLVMQRPDSSFLPNGARDNFHITISLGNLSKEAKSMLYNGEELPDHIYSVGEGICWIDGKGLVEIKYPEIQNMKKLENKILNSLSDAAVKPQETEL